MTKNEFILQAMISMAGSKGQFNNTFHCVHSEAKRVAEAAKILASIIGLSEDEETKVFAEDYKVPVWARVGVYTMCSLGIFSEADSATLTASLTRADTANYLYKMMEII